MRRRQAFRPFATRGRRTIAGILATFALFSTLTVTVSIWVNRRTTSDVRATVHSFLSQAETIGEIVGGFALALLARAAGISVTLITSASLIALAGIIVGRSRADRV